MSNSDAVTFEALSAPAEVNSGEPSRKRGRDEDTPNAAGVPMDLAGDGTLVGVPAPAVATAVPAAPKVGPGLLSFTDGYHAMQSAGSVLRKLPFSALGSPHFTGSEVCPQACPVVASDGSVFDVAIIASAVPVSGIEYKSYPVARGEAQMKIYSNLAGVFADFTVRYANLLPLVQDGLYVTAMLCDPSKAVTYNSMLPIPGISWHAAFYAACSFLVTACWTGSFIQADDLNVSGLTLKTSARAVPTYGWPFVIVEDYARIEVIIKSNSNFEAGALPTTLVGNPFNPPFLFCPSIADAYLVSLQIAGVKARQAQMISGPKPAEIEGDAYVLAPFQGPYPKVADFKKLMDLTKEVHAKFKAILPAGQSAGNVPVLNMQRVELWVARGDATALKNAYNQVYNYLKRINDSNNAIRANLSMGDASRKTDKTEKNRAKRARKHERDIASGKKQDSSLLLRANPLQFASL